MTGTTWVALLIVPSAEVNAWTDGRRVAVTSGLVRYCTEVELGGVLAHETAHVLMHHVVRQRFARRHLSAHYSQGSSVGGVDGFFEHLTVAAGIAVATSRLSRRFEMDADTVGESVAKAAGYEGGLVDFLLSLPLEREAPGVLDTHPPIAQRIRALAERLLAQRGEGFGFS